MMINFFLSLSEETSSFSKIFLEIKTTQLKNFGSPERGKHNTVMSKKTLNRCRQHYE